MLHDPGAELMSLLEAEPNSCHEEKKLHRLEAQIGKARGG